MYCKVTYTLLLDVCIALPSCKRFWTEAVNWHIHSEAQLCQAFLVCVVCSCWLLKARCAMLASVKPVPRTSEQLMLYCPSLQYKWSGASGAGVSLFVTQISAKNMLSHLTVHQHGWLNPTKLCIHTLSPPLPACLVTSTTYTGLRWCTLWR